MSIFGGASSSKNIFNITKDIQSALNIDDVLNTLTYLYDTMEQIKVIINDILNKDKYAIIPEYGFGDVSVKLTGGQFQARRIYYAMGFPTINGKCDCDLLEKLYNEHPLLSGYDFMTSEPNCCP